MQQARKRLIVTILCALTLVACSPTNSGSRESVAVASARPAAPRISIENLQFAGAFALPEEQYGSSSLNWAEGVIEVNGNSMFIVGHDHDDAVAEFSIPALVKSQSIADLNVAAAPSQPFVRVLERARAGNPDELDQITGLEVVDGALIVNAVEYYDAPADNRRTTLVVSDAGALASSPVSAFYSLSGRARAAGWISEIPLPWQGALGAEYVTGNSSGGPIISRHSVGPSAFGVDLRSLLTSRSTGKIKTRELLGFSLDRPLHSDLLNESGKNNLWTHLSQVRYGFIVPGTSSYLTVGWSGGHGSGVGYKIKQQGADPCSGYCTPSIDDNYNFYWLWDVNDLYAVGRGKVSPSSVKPYASGRFDPPFQGSAPFKAIGGASYDAKSQLLYISLLKANNTLGEYSNPPIIVAYKIVM